MELRDKNGLTEQEFLATYDADKYPKPSLTADVAVFAHDGETLRLLLIRRGEHPYLGCLALPGGFANKNEPIEQTAVRELEEETGITGVPLALLCKSRTLGYADCEHPQPRPRKTDYVVRV